MGMQPALTRTAPTSANASTATLEMEGLVSGFKVRMTFVRPLSWCKTLAVFSIETLYSVAFYFGIVNFGDIILNIIRQIRYIVKKQICESSKNLFYQIDCEKEELHQEGFETATTEWNWLVGPNPFATIFINFNQCDWFFKFCFFSNTYY